MLCRVTHGSLALSHVQEGTGRIVMWTSMGIRNSYTMEVGTVVVWEMSDHLYIISLMQCIGYPIKLSDNMAIDGFCLIIFENL